MARFPSEIDKQAKRLSYREKSADAGRQLKANDDTTE